MIIKFSESEGKALAQHVKNGGSLGDMLPGSATKFTLWACLKCGDGDGYYTKCIATLRQHYEANHAAYDTDINTVRGGSRFYCEMCHHDVTDSVIKSQTRGTG